MDMSIEALEHPLEDLVEGARARRSGHVVAKALLCKACRGSVEVTLRKHACPCGRSTGQLLNDGKVLVVGPASLMIDRAGRFVEGVEGVDVLRPVYPLL